MFLVFYVFNFIGITQEAFEGSLCIAFYSGKLAKFDKALSYPFVNLVMSIHINLGFLNPIY